MNPVTIAGRPIGDAHPCFVVAEAGTNHEGDLDNALEMIRRAADAGADAVKFQSFLADELVPRRHPEYAALKRTEMPKNWYPLIREAGEAHGIIVFSTASNETTLAWMEALDFPCYKIASGNLTHLPLIRRAAQIGKPLILSTGFATGDEIMEAETEAANAGADGVILLHCVGNYPAMPDELNLSYMDALRWQFEGPVGYSDHTLHSLAAKAAVAMGAHVIERHVTLTPNATDGDHPISSSFRCLKRLIGDIREVEPMLGQDEKIIGERERANGLRARRLLHTARDIPAGKEIRPEDLLCLRPTGRLESLTGKVYGLPPAAMDWVVGRKARRAIQEQAPVLWQDMEITLGWED